MYPDNFDTEDLDTEAADTEKPIACRIRKTGAAGFLHRQDFIVCAGDSAVSFSEEIHITYIFYKFFIKYKETY